MKRSLCSEGELTRFDGCQQVPPDLRRDPPSAVEVQGVTMLSSFDVL